MRLSCRHQFQVRVPSSQVQSGFQLVHRVPDAGFDMRSQRQRRLGVEVPAAGAAARETGAGRRRRSSRRCRSTATAAARTPACRARRRAPRRRRAGGCSPTRRRRCRRSARRASAPPRTCDRAAPRRRRAGSWRRCRRPRCGQRGAERAGADGLPSGRRRSLAHEPQHRGLQAAEAESMRRATSGGSSPSPVARGALRSACVSRAVGKSKARSLPSRASAIDRRPARIAQPEQLRHLVVRLPRRIVARPAEQLVDAGLGDEVEAGVAARDDQHHRRQRQLAVREHQRLDVAGQMVHGNDRQAARPGERLRERHADQQRPDQPRPLRHRDRAEIGAA